MQIGGYGALCSAQSIAQSDDTGERYSSEAID
jgi:hypothetical protein